MDVVTDFVLRNPAVYFAVGFALGVAIAALGFSEPGDDPVVTGGVFLVTLTLWPILVAFLLVPLAGAAIKFVARRIFR